MKDFYELKAYAASNDPAPPRSQMGRFKAVKKKSRVWARTSDIGHLFRERDVLSAMSAAPRPVDLSWDIEDMSAMSRDVRDVR
jgi:hypothetical protein